MNLDIIEKYVHLTPMPNNNIEVMFGGQPCLNVHESFDGGFSWRINPLFAKLTYGANIFEDVPFCYSSLDTVEEAIANGLAALNDLGAFHGIIDLPTDSYVEEHLDEAVITEEFSVGQRVRSNAVGSAGHHGVITKVGNKTHEVHFALLGKKNVPHTNLSDDSIKKESVDELDEAVTHKELLAGAQKAYIEATRQGNGVMAKHYGAQILKHKADLAKQMAAAKQKRMAESEEQIDEAEYNRYAPDSVGGRVLGKYGNIPERPKVSNLDNAANVARIHKKHGLFHTQKQLAFDDEAYAKYKEINIKESLDERADREDDEGYARTKNADDAHNEKIAFKKTYKPAPRKTPEQEKAEWDKWVKECITDDCRKEALKHSDSIMEAQDLAQGLLDSVMDELNEGEWADSLKARASTLVKKLNKQKLHKLTVRPVAGTDKDLLGKVGEFGEKNDLSKDEHYNKALSDAHEYGKTKFKGKYEITHEDQRGQKIRGGSLAKVRKGMNESLDEAALSGDAYWKAKEEAAKEAKAKEERASMGIKEPVKKGRGKPTNIDLEFVHAAAKKNVEAGKRPTAGMERNEKIHFVRHLAKHPDFAEKHVAAAGRPTGTTSAAKAEKEVAKKKETSAFSMWAGLGKK